MLLREAITSLVVELRVDSFVSSNKVDSGKNGLMVLAGNAARSYLEGESSD